MAATLLLTSLSLSFPGMDQWFHHDSSLSHFQELPSSPSPPLAPVAVIPWYPFSPEFMAAMQELIVLWVWDFLHNNGGGGYKVSLNVYDLSNGLAWQLSISFLGKPIELI